MKMLTLALASLVLAAQVGCGRSPTFDRLPPPPSEEIRARLGRVVVRSETDLLAESVLLPAVASSCSAAGLGSLAGIGTGVGLTVGMWSGSSGGGFGRSGGGGGVVFAFFLVIALWVCLLVASIPIGALCGSIWGLSKAPSGEELERARRILSKAILERRLTDQIKERVVERATRDADARVSPWAPGAERDTILEITGPRVVLQGPMRFDAPLRLTSEIEVRLIGSRDGALLHSFRLRKVGGEKSFQGWVGEDGSAVAAELGDPEDFAARIVDEIFLLVELPEGARP